MAVLLVSNRLPVTVRHSADGLSLVESHGGVATGLAAVHAAPGGRWIGWPGPTHGLSPETLPELNQRLATRRCVPVYLDQAEVRGFYQGFSNGVLWPVCHYLIQQVPLFPRHWETYERVNQRFAEVIAEQWAPGDEVWIHDYQLMRVPALLRQLRPEARIGYFHHIPFPAHEVFRVLPARRLLLEGLLGADLIGFHTPSYAEHFGACVTRLLGVNALEEGRFDYDGRTPTVGVFPMGIDFDRFEKPRTEEPPAGERRPPAAGQTLLAIDRLDYTKGIPRRLLAFEQLLRGHPDLRDKVTLLQVAVPSRTGVKAYQRFRRRVDAMVGRINGAFGSQDWTPVHYLYRGFSQTDLVALYRSADVMLVTPVRDGMNLVAKEFIASRTDGDGVLVLSEFTGAAADLIETVQVNPYDIEESAEAYYRALTMPAVERRVRMRALRARVRTYTTERWTESFLTALRAVPRPDLLPVAGLSSPEDLHAELARIGRAPSLVILLDYDGTLIPFASTPNLAPPDDELLALLGALATRRDTRVHLVSGRQREILESWFGGLGVGLHAEHGSWSLEPGETEWRRHEAVRPVPYDALLSLLRAYTERTPGSLIERKSAGLTWHFRLADRELGSRTADTIVDEVHRRFPPETVEVLRGEKIIEFRPTGVHKGLIVDRLRQQYQPHPVIVAVGDDTTDEDMFAALTPGDLGVHVGPRASGAEFRLRDAAACRTFLQGLLEIVPAPG
jgi:trehalose 6-phosphate synthase/phosphatase